MTAVLDAGPPPPLAPPVAGLARPAVDPPGSSPSSPAAAWAAAVVLVATAATVDPWGFRPFTTARWALVGVTVAMAAAITPWRLPRRLAALWLAFLAGLAVATAVALDPLLAVLGHPRRHLGLAGWLVCALAWAAGTGVAATARGWRTVGRGAVVAGLVTGAAGVADAAGWDPFGVHFAGGRAGGLLGQPVYLGALAVLLAPVAAGLAADAGAGRAWRLAGVAAAATGGAALLASQTRGAWLGAAVAAAVIAPRLWRRHRTRRRWLVAGAGLVAAAALAWPVGARVAATFDPGAPGGRGRLDEWVVAARVIAAHPLAGVGPEGYRIAAPAHVDAGYARRHGRDEVIDRAHDGPLDVAAAAGIPAALAYVVLVGAVVVRAGRVARRGRHPVVVGAALGVIAWAVQQLVSFPIAEVDPAAWLLAGVVVLAAGAGGAGTRPPPAPHRTGWRVASALAAGALAVALAAGGVTAVAADRALDRAEHGAGGAPGGPAAVRAADRATALRPDDVDAWYEAARLASSGPSLLAVDAGLDRVEAGLRHEPRDPALLALDEELLVERALRSGLPADLVAAEAAARAQIARDPAGPHHHRLLGLVLAARGPSARAAAGAELRRAGALGEARG